MVSTTVVDPLHMTTDSIRIFLEHEKGQGASNDCLRQRKTFVTKFYNWLPDDKLITIQILQAWRSNLVEMGFSATTIMNYVKGINRYLDFMDRSDLRFNKGRPKDLTGKEYGYLTAIENTGQKDRNDYVWRCRCKCGKEVLLPATRMLTGNTLSCGCLQTLHLQNVNLYIDNTSLRSAMEERIYSSHSSSGYTGVSAKHDKWQAYITYKGKHYSLGCYSKLEDAVKARARAKEMVRQDAEQLAIAYKILHQEDPPLPSKRNNIEAASAAPKQSNNAN